MITDFSYHFQSSHRDGGYMPPLRPGQVKVHDGDVTTYIYDLSGLGKGIGREFEGWWLAIGGWWHAESEWHEIADGQCCDAPATDEPTFTYAG